MFTERLSFLPATLGAFTPCPPVENRAAWNGLPSVVRTALLARGDAAHSFAFENFSADEYRTFCRTGNRLCYETKYFSQRRALNDLIMAECAANHGQYLDAIINGIFALCEESAWQIPAHNSYLRDTQQLPLPDSSRPVIDLFAAETGALLSMAYYLLHTAFDRISPVISHRILQEVDARLIQPYLHRHFWWMGNGDEPMCNWTSWCTQNILLTVFCTPQTDATRRAVLTQASYSLDCFLKDYGEDGCCNEGAQYYHHAALTLFGAMEVLCAVASDAFLPLFDVPKIRNMAAYILHMHVADQYYINFADCSPFAGRRSAREYLFAKRTQNDALCAFAAADFFAAQKDAPDDNDIARINLWYLTLNAFTAAEMFRAAADAAPILPSEIFYPSVGVFVARDDTYCLAVKAGNNGDSHNHNDTGSIILYKNGSPFLIDIGVESYTQKTFSPQRYEIWTMQSAWHNLPTFDGVMQKDGARYCAKEVVSRFDEKQSALFMELADAWPPEAHLSRYQRTVTLHKNSHIEVDEHCSGTFRSAVLSLMFCKAPQTNGIDMVQTIDGKILFTGAQGIEIEPVAITDSKLHSTWGATLWRALVRFSDDLFWEIQ